MPSSKLLIFIQEGQFIRSEIDRLKDMKGTWANGKRESLKSRLNTVAARIKTFGVRGTITKVVVRARKRISETQVGDIETFVIYFTDAEPDDLPFLVKYHLLDYEVQQFTSDIIKPGTAHKINR